MREILDPQIQSRRPRRPALWRVLLLYGMPAVVPARQSIPAPAYRLTDLACARFHQSVESSIRVESGNRSLRQASGRDGVLTLKARDSLPGFSLETWFDSLMVWRDEPAGKRQADTDGVIGGRYRGLLLPLGGYTRIDTPFIPDPVAELTDLTSVLDDLLPPLPGIPLSVGQRWQDTTGWVIARISDQHGLQRYRISGTRIRRDKVVLPDSSTVDSEGTEKETGLMLWDPARGLSRWDRSIDAEASVPATGPVPRGAHTEVEQNIRLDRLPGCPP